MDALHPISISPPRQAVRPTIPIGEYVRLFQGPYSPTRQWYIRYFWHVLHDLDQSLTALHAHFGDRWKRAMDPKDLLAYVKQRRAEGITDAAIRHELFLLNAVIVHRVECYKHRRKCKRPKAYTVPCGKVFKQLPLVVTPAPPEQPRRPVEDVYATIQQQEPQATPPVAIPAGPPPPGMRQCDRCGRAFPLGWRMRQRYCSDNCSRSAAYRRSRGYAETFTRLRTVPCVACGRDFGQKTITQRYCSHACGIAHGEAALQLLEARLSIEEIAPRLGVPVSTVKHAMRLAREARKEDRA